jgi:acetyltransferase-like isoleucine patch superfamily enzyme
MVDGDPYTGLDPVLIDMQARTQVMTAAFMAVPPEDMPARIEALRAMVGEMTGIAVILPPFFMEYGVHLRLGDGVFVNRGSVFLDSAWITLGDGTMVGPNVQFVTVGHPVRPEDRFQETPGAPILPFRPIAFAKPITVGRMCWIGAGSIILPGVTIGDGTTIGAGSVVTKSIPARVVAAGNPARVIRSVDG